MAKLEAIVLQADKGKSFVVVDEMTYLAMAQDHVAKDIRTGPKEVSRSQRVLSCTARALGNVLGVGRCQSDHAYSQCMDNLGSEAEDVPVLKILPKTHKVLGPLGHPQSRPVVTAATGLSSRAGDIVADFLDPLVNVATPRLEDRSTEEVLAQLQETEVKIREDGLTGTMVGSLDVAALYPSLDQEGCAETVARFVRSSKVSLNGIDWRAAQVYLSSSLTENQVKEEALVGLVPRRLKTRGNRPGKTTTELSRKRKDPTTTGPEVIEPTKWAATDPSTLTETEKRLIISVVMKVAVRTVFAHHMYQFAGDTYWQDGGAPIGLRLTSVVARIVMDGWAVGFITKLVDAGVVLHMIAKYVDDINVVLDRLRRGSRWTNDRIEWTQEWEQDDIDDNKSEELVTMEVIKCAAESVIDWLSFTFDLPESNISGTVPVLDLQVWVRHPGEDEDGLGSDLLAWTYYEKPMASSKVMRATSVFTWRQKVTTMTMEIFRRLRNSTRQLNLEHRTKLVTDIVDNEIEWLPCWVSEGGPDLRTYVLLQKAKNGFARWTTPQRQR